jgi:hypothetical protein
LAAAWYVGLTGFALASAYVARGLRRAHGVMIGCAYLAFSGVVASTAYGSNAGLLLSIAAPAAAAFAASAWLRPRRARGPWRGHPR